MIKNCTKQGRMDRFIVEELLARGGGGCIYSLFDYLFICIPIRKTIFQWQLLSCLNSENPTASRRFIFLDHSAPYLISLETKKRVLNYYVTRWRSCLKLYWCRNVANFDFRQ